MYLAVAAFSVSAMMTLIAEMPISKVVLLCLKLTETEVHSKFVYVCMCVAMHAFIQFVQCFSFTI